MALLYSAPRGSRLSAQPRQGVHPAICLLSGFGVIFGLAGLVHVVFNMLT